MIFNNRNKTLSKLSQLSVTSPWNETLKCLNFVEEHHKGIIKHFSFCVHASYNDAHWYDFRVLGLVHDITGPIFTITTIWRAMHTIGTCSMLWGTLNCKLKKSRFISGKIAFLAVPMSKGLI